MHEPIDSNECSIFLLTYLKFEPVNMFMHNCNIFYIIIYASYYVNQTCDEIEIGIVGKCGSSPLSNDAISVSIQYIV